MNAAEQWSAIAALVQAVLIVALVILIKSEERRAHKGTHRGSR